MELDNNRLKKLTIGAILGVAISNVFGFQGNTPTQVLSDSQKTIIKNTLDSMIGKFDKADSNAVNKSLNLLLGKIKNQIKGYNEIQDKDLNMQRKILVLEYLQQLLEVRIANKAITNNKSDKPSKNTNKVELPVTTPNEYPSTNTRAS
ncbi:MAG: hypothetical protein V3575_02100 [Candidatus Absconditabacteria bacterium]